MEKSAFWRFIGKKQSFDWVYGKLFNRVLFASYLQNISDKQRTFL